MQDGKIGKREFLYSSCMPLLLGLFLLISAVVLWKLWVTEWIEFPVEIGNVQNQNLQTKAHLMQTHGYRAFLVFIVAMVGLFSFLSGVFHTLKK